MEPTGSDLGKEAEDVLARMPPSVRRIADRLLERWLGRVLLRMTATVARIELFDRSMSVAAQFFTSVFPILILMATWLGGASDQVAEALDMPKQTRDVLDSALKDNSTASFGVIGALIVLVSATSLSRALTRAFASIWLLPRPKSKLTSAWRWVAVVLTLALSLVLIRALARIADDIPPPGVWKILLTVVLYTAIALFVPWLLLQGVVPIRHLLPGALIFAVVMMIARPAYSLYLPRALSSSAEKYGSIGVAFTYLAWLYVISFIFLASAAFGQVLASDRGGFGAWIRGERPLRQRRSVGSPTS
jgi:membrane protein